MLDWSRGWLRSAETSNRRGVLGEVADVRCPRQFFHNPASNKSQRNISQFSQNRDGMGFESNLIILYQWLTVMQGK